MYCEDCNKQSMTASGYRQHCKSKKHQINSNVHINFIVPIKSTDNVSVKAIG